MYKFELLQMNHVTLCITPTVLYTKVDAHYDKLAMVVSELR